MIPAGHLDNPVFRPENIKAKSQERFLTNKQKIIAGLSVLVLSLVIGGGIALEHLSRNSETDTAQDNEPKQEQSNTVETSKDLKNMPPEQVAAGIAAEKIPTVEELELDASLKSDPEKLMQAFTGDVTTWMNDGSIPERAKQALDTYDTLSYATKVAEERNSKYTEAMFIDGWESVPSLVKWNEKMQRIHRSTISAYYSTSFPSISPDDQEPYRRESIVTSVRVLDNNADKLVVRTVQHDSDNADKNKIGKQSEKFGGGVTGEDNEPIYTFVIEDGKVKLSDIVLD